MTETERRILIIDPNCTERTIMAAFLRSENFYVETGRGLTYALEKISEGCFNCLIMDVNLPEMRGYEAVSIINTHPCWRQPVLSHLNHFFLCGISQRFNSYR